VATEIPARGGKSGRVFCIHCFSPIFAGQGRGIPELGTSIQWMEDILTLTESELQKAINQASISVFTESQSEDAPGNPFSALVNSDSDVVWDKIQGKTDNTAETATTAAGTTPVKRFERMPEATLDKPSVGIFNLPGRAKITPFQSTAPSTGFNQFVEELVGFIAAAKGMSVETITMKFSANYSASRAALILMWRNAIKKRYLRAITMAKPHWY
jgi:capsid protein